MGCVAHQGVFMVGFSALVAWGIVSLIRGSSGTRPHERTAEDVLAERFARGEVDEDEFIKCVTRSDLRDVALGDQFVDADGSSRAHRSTGIGPCLAPQAH